MCSLYKNKNYHFTWPAQISNVLYPWVTVCSPACTAFSHNFSPWHRRMFWSNTILTFQIVCDFPFLSVISIIYYLVFFFLFSHGNFWDFRVSSWLCFHLQGGNLYYEITKRLNQALMSFTPQILFWPTDPFRNNCQWNYFTGRSCWSAAHPAFINPSLMNTGQGDEKCFKANAKQY